MIFLFYIRQVNSPFRKYENFHIVLWLIKDFCWIANLKTAGMIMIVPTIGMALFITWKSRQVVSEFLHNLAVVFWICANSIWMFGEFYLNDGTRPYAIVFFILGLMSVGFHYLVMEPRRKRRENIID